MSILLRAFYPDGRVFERDYVSERGLKLDTVRPHRIEVINPSQEMLNRLHMKVCPQHGVVVIVEELV